MNHMEVNGTRLNILHVLTLNGRNGEYGGPVRVARELCKELSTRGHQTTIFSGAIRGSEPISEHGCVENFHHVKPILRLLPISTLWNWRILQPLTKEIRKADLVHIHFARELIPFATAIISLLNRKPFIAQTHGMIIYDGRLSTRIIDFLFTRHLIKKSKVHLVLSETELSSIRSLRIKSTCKILPNGIAINFDQRAYNADTKRIGFCSRLESRKGVDKFIELADRFRDSGITFEIYGPDGGELQLLRREIEARNLVGILEYKGSLPAESVQKVLSQLDLLVLPSKNEPFPMVILESLAVGTPILVMPSCGIAAQLAKFEPSFVAQSENLEGLVASLNLQLLRQHATKNRTQIIDYCRKEFCIVQATNQLIGEYKNAVCHGE